MFLTFPLQEVEGAQKATGGRDFRIRIPSKLCKLIPWKVDETSDTAKYQISEDLRVLMFQPLHKKIRVKDYRLAGVRHFLGDEYTAFCPTNKKRNTVIVWLLKERLCFDLIHKIERSNPHRN